MSSNPFVVAIMGVAILNGIFSPFFVITSQVVITAMLPFLLLAGPSLFLFFSSLLAATATIALAGVPAALFERLTGRSGTDAAVYSVWLVTALVLSFPAFLRVASLVL